MKSWKIKLGILFIVAGAFFLLTSHGWSAEVKFDGLYISKAKDADYVMYLRFYKDGTVISVTSTGSAEKVATWFRRGGGTSQGNYTITESQIKFTTSSTYGSVDYDGIISGNVLDFKVHSNINNKDHPRKYEFVKVDVASDKPVEKKERTKIKVKGIESGGWITEIVYYDNYDRPYRSDLVNKNGEIVARRGRVFAAMSLVQSFLAFGGPLNSKGICDIDPNEIFFATNHDSMGNPEISRSLCLNKNGDLIMDGENPLIVDTFPASQKTEIKYNYKGAFKDKAYKKIFPCDNCAKHIGNSDVTYIW